MVDIVHALEYFWEAGRMQFEERSDELTAWFKKQEHRLYRGKMAAQRHLHPTGNQHVPQLAGTSPPCAGVPPAAACRACTSCAQRTALSGASKRSSRFMCPLGP